MRNSKIKSGYFSSNIFSSLCEFCVTWFSLARSKHHALTKDKVAKRCEILSIEYEIVVSHVLRFYSNKIVLASTSRAKI